LLSALGLIIAATLNLAFTHSIYYAVMSVNAYKTEAFETTILLLSGFGVIIAITILLSLPIKKISPKKLMEE